MSDDEYDPNLDPNMDAGDPYGEHKSRILNETKNVSSFVVIGQTLHKLYYEDKLMKTQKEFLEWTKQNLGFSKSTTYEYIISYRIYSEIANKIGKEFRPPMYQSHCQLLSKVPQKKLVETWIDVCKQAPNGVITTAFLENYLDKNNLRSKTGRISMHANDGHHGDGDDLDGDDLHKFGDENGNLLQHPVQLPINEPLIFELSKSVVLGNQFDMILQCVEDFRTAEPRVWYGRLWANLTSVRPLTTSSYAAPQLSMAAFEGGLEHLLRIIFTKFANKEFVEGLFLLRAEFGADWFTPILQHPYCILRHTNPTPQTVIPAHGSKRQKRQSGHAVMGLSPPFESYVMFYLGPNIKDFCHVFRSIGLVPGINSWSAVMSVNNVMTNVGLMGVPNPVGGVIMDEDAAAMAAAAAQMGADGGELEAAGAGAAAPAATGGQQQGAVSEAASALVDIART